MGCSLFIQVALITKKLQPQIQKLAEERAPHDLAPGEGLVRGVTVLVCLFFLGGRGRWEVWEILLIIEILQDLIQTSDTISIGVLVAECVYVCIR